MIVLVQDQERTLVFRASLFFLSPYLSLSVTMSVVIVPQGTSPDDAKNGKESWWDRVDRALNEWADRLTPAREPHYHHPIDQPEEQPSSLEDERIVVESIQETEQDDLPLVEEQENLCNRNGRTQWKRIGPIICCVAILFVFFIWVISRVASTMKQ